MLCKFRGGKKSFSHRYVGVGGLRSEIFLKKDLKMGKILTRGENYIHTSREME